MIQEQEKLKITKEELRDKFRACQLELGDLDMTRSSDGSYESLHTQLAWVSWVECARELGVLQGAIMRDNTPYTPYGKERLTRCTEIDVQRIREVYFWLHGILRYGQDHVLSNSHLDSLNRAVVVMHERTKERK